MKKTPKYVYYHLKQNLVLFAGSVWSAPLRALCFVTLTLQFRKVHKPIKKEAKASVVPTKTQLDAMKQPHIRELQD